MNLRKCLDIDRCNCESLGIETEGIEDSSGWERDDGWCDEGDDLLDGERCLECVGEGVEAKNIIYES